MKQYLGDTCLFKSDIEQHTHSKAWVVTVEAGIEGVKREKKDIVKKKVQVRNLEEDLALFATGSGKRGHWERMTQSNGISRTLPRFGAKSGGVFIRNSGGWTIRSEMVPRWIGGCGWGYICDRSKLRNSEGGLVGRELEITREFQLSEEVKLLTHYYWGI